MDFSKLKIGELFKFDYDADNKTLRKVDPKHYVLVDGSWGNRKFEYSSHDGEVNRVGQCPIPPTLCRGVHGWDSVKLHKEYSAKELAAAICEINSDPANKDPHGGVYMLTKAARTRTDKLAWAVSYHLACEP